MAGDVFRRYFALLRKNALLTIRSPMHLIIEVVLPLLVIQQVCFKIYFDGKPENLDAVREKRAIERPEFVKTYLFDTTGIGEFLKQLDRKNWHLKVKVAAGTDVNKQDFELWKERMDALIEIKVAGSYEDLKKELKSESGYVKANRSIAGLFISELNWKKGHISYELITSSKAFNSPDFNNGWEKTSQLEFRYSLAMLVQYITDFHFIENFKSAFASNITAVRPAVNHVGIKQVTMAEVRAKNMIVAIMALFTVRNILHDKAHRKDFLAVMGVSNIVFYLSHLTVLLLKQFLVILPITLLVILNINEINIGFYLLSMTLEAFCVLSLVVLITIIWKKNSSASFLTIVLLFLPFNVVTVSPNAGHHSILLLLNFWIAASNFEESLERAGFQMQNVNLFSSSGSHEYPPVVPLIFLVVDFFLMLFISWAFVSFSSLYNKFKKSRKNNSEEKPPLFENAEEEFDSSAEVDITISDVTKIYSGGEEAVNGLNLSALKGQVTVLLEHNGAGKTTTFSTICGITKPTSGSVKICGELAGTPKAKQSIGYCPRENSLIPDLTVLDHLRLAHGLKCAKTHFQKEIEELLEMVGLEDRKTTKVKRLSGGQKRKVCLCMALIGGSQVILLDAGMDPESRQDVEMLLEKHKDKRNNIGSTSEGRLEDQDPKPIFRAQSDDILPSQPKALEGPNRQKMKGSDTQLNGTDLMVQQPEKKTRNLVPESEKLVLFEFILRCLSETRPITDWVMRLDLTGKKMCQILYTYMESKEISKDAVNIIDTWGFSIHLVYSRIAVMCLKEIIGDHTLEKVRKSIEYEIIQDAMFTFKQYGMCKYKHADGVESSTLFLRFKKGETYRNLKEVLLHDKLPQKNYTIDNCNEKVDLVKSQKGFVTLPHVLLFSGDLYNNRSLVEAAGYTPIFGLLKDAKGSHCIRTMSSGKWDEEKWSIVAFFGKRSQDNLSETLDDDCSQTLKLTSYNYTTPSRLENRQSTCMLNASINAITICKKETFNQMYELARHDRNLWGRIIQWRKETSDREISEKWKSISILPDDILNEFIVANTLTVMKENTANGYTRRAKGALTEDTAVQMLSTMSRKLRSSVSYEEITNIVEMKEKLGSKSNFLFRFIFNKMQIKIGSLIPLMESHKEWETVNIVATMNRHVICISVLSSGAIFEVDDTSINVYQNFTEFHKNLDIEGIYLFPKYNTTESEEQKPKIEKQPKPSDEPKTSINPNVAQLPESAPEKLAEV